jgi:HAD superfamily hydrolase (TIGR01509 family)
MIKGIIFDAGDILYSTNAVYRVMHDSLKKLKINVKHQDIRKEWNRIKSKSQARKQTRGAAWTELGIKFGVDKKLINKFKKMLNFGYKKGWKTKPYPGVSSTLRRLKKRGYALAVLSDTLNSAKSRKKIYDKLGFGRYIDVVVTSADLKATKPHPKAFNTTIKKMGLKKPEIVFVAHEKDELDGAIKQKIKTIGFHLEDGAKAHYVAKKFTDIYKIVEQLK